MSTEVPDIVREAKRRRKALDGVDRMEELLVLGDGSLPSMIETLWQMFNDDSTVPYGQGERPKVPPETKLAIANLFADKISLKRQAEAAIGLRAGPKKVEHHQHLTLVFNKTKEEIEAMDPVAREVYIQMNVKALAVARGESAT